MNRRYPVILKPIPEGYLAQFPDLPSVVTSGTSIDDALEMAQDALSAALLTMEDEGLTPPAPTTLESLLPALQDGIPSMVSVDTLRYRMMTDTKSVRKNVSMPAWMAQMIEARNLNASQILQNAIRSQIEADENVSA